MTCTDLVLVMSGNESVLESYLDSVQALPPTIKRRFALIRELDEKCRQVEMVIATSYLCFVGGAAIELLARLCCAVTYC